MSRKTKKVAYLVYNQRLPCPKAIREAACVLGRPARQVEVLERVQERAVLERDRGAVAVRDAPSPPLFERLGEMTEATMTSSLHQKFEYPQF